MDKFIVQLATCKNGVLCIATLSNPLVCGTKQIFLLIVNLVSVLSVFVVSWCSAFVHDCACMSA